MLSAAPTGASSESIHALVHAHPERRAEVFRRLADLPLRFVGVAMERLPQHRAHGAIALIITALAETIEERLPDDADLADRLWSGVLSMCMVVTDPGAES